MCFGEKRVEKHRIFACFAHFFFQIRGKSKPFDLTKY